jgi:predicted Zn-dependent protease
LNAFALPGGQVFITAGLFGALETEGQLAGVLGHEIGHVAARHSAEHIAKQKLTQGLTGAAVLATYDPNDPSTQRTAAVAAVIGNLVNMRFGREDELESDRLGVRFMSEAGYDPRAMLGVLEILAQAGGGGRQPEFFSTHPNPENRIAKLQAAIAERFPNGVQSGLTP